MDITEVFKKENILRIENETYDKKEVLNKLSNHLVKLNKVNKDYPKAILEREKLFPTGLTLKEISIAIPHADCKFVKETSVAIGLLKKPVKFNFMGGADEEIVNAKIIFMLAVKDKDEQIEMLQFIMSLLENSLVIRKIYETEKDENIINLLNEFYKEEFLK